MEQEHIIKEFHKSEAHRKLVRMSTANIKQQDSLSIPQPSPASEKTNKRKKLYVNSITLRTSCIFPDLKIETRPRLDSLVSSHDSSFGPQSNSVRKLSENIETEDHKEIGPSNFKLARAAELTKKLNESKSPNPISGSENIDSEKIMEEMVTSAKKEDHPLISHFYGKDIATCSTNKQWRIALKNYISQTLHSICLIKKLTPVPLELIYKKSLTLPLPSDSIFIYYNIK